MKRYRANRSPHRDTDRLINLATALARRRMEENKDLAAAYRESDAETASAWREDPEFSNALHLAVLLGDTKPLKNYLCSEKPLSSTNRSALAGYIDLLVERIQTGTQKRTRGRPCRIAAKAALAEQAERNAAWRSPSCRKSGESSTARRISPRMLSMR